MDSDKLNRNKTFKGSDNVNKEKIQVYIPKTNLIKEIDRDFKKFMMAHIEMIGCGYKDGEVWIGNSERIEITKDSFKIITDENNEIIFKIIR